MEHDCKHVNINYSDYVQTLLLPSYSNITGSFLQDILGQILKCLTFFCGSEHITYFLENSRGHRTVREKILSFTFPECNPILRTHFNPNAPVWRLLDELPALTVWTYFYSCHTIVNWISNNQLLATAKTPLVRWHAPGGGQGSSTGSSLCNNW